MSNTPLAAPHPAQQSRWWLGAALVGMFLYQWNQGSAGRDVAFAQEAKAEAPPPVATPPAAPVPPPALPPARDTSKIEFAEMLKRDPVAALRQAFARHEQMVSDYICTFIKQELLPGGMSQEQQIEVKFRAKPFSVFMHWIKNPDKAVRVIYVEGKWVDPNAARPEERDLAVCQPGAIAQLFVKSVKQPIRGTRAKQASRRFIDDFGFQKALGMMVDASAIAAKRNELMFRLEGEGTFDGRPTWILYRELPYPGPNNEYPDAACTYYIDQEWRVPVAVYSYADKQKKKLLGKYEYKSVRINTGLTDAEFEPSRHGM